MAVLSQLAVTPLLAAPADPDSAPAAAAGGGLEEIVVTATRRQERLQDVPISVLAFSQEKLDSQGLKSIDDLSRLSPGLNFQRNGMSSAGNYNDEGSDINIRGVDSTAGTSTTGIYIDDTPIQTRHVGFGSDQCVPGAVRPGAGRSPQRPARHAVRCRRRGRRGAVHHPGTRSHQDQHLCPRRRGGHGWRCSELRGRRRFRCSPHRQRAGVPGELLLPPRRRLGGSHRVRSSNRTRPFCSRPRCTTESPPTPMPTTGIPSRRASRSSGRSTMRSRSCRRSTTSTCKSTIPPRTGSPCRIPARTSIATGISAPIRAMTRSI